MVGDIIFRSKLPDIDISNTIPLHKYCFELLPEVADRPCIIDGTTNTILTYAELHRMINSATVSYHDRLGIRKGTVVMNLLRNCAEFVVSFFAATRLGAAVTTANPYCKPEEIAKQVAASNTTVIITESCAYEKVQGLANARGIQVVTIDEHYENCIHFSELLLIDSNKGDVGDDDVPEDKEFNPDDIAALPYSSGTTGLQKGVMLTHRSMITSVAQQVDGENPHICFDEHDVILCSLPIFHIYCLSTIMMAGLRAGSALVIMKKFDLVKMMELVEKYKITIAPFVPPIVMGVVKSDEVANYDLSSIRMVMCGAAPMGKDIEDAFMAKLPKAVFGQGYGMTEAGPVLSMCLAFAKEPFTTKSGACGTVVRNAELMILDPDTGLSVGRNMPGEICIRGEQIMKGYLNDPEATANTIIDGWLHTGDVGYVDDDDEVFIVDRLKEIIKYKGFQVAPAELEALLNTNPAIADAAVIGERGGVEIGELPVAFITKAKDAEISEDEVKKFVEKQVIYYKKIHKVFFRDVIPRAPSGKILRKDLRAWLETQKNA